MTVPVQLDAQDLSIRTTNNVISTTETTTRDQQMRSTGLRSVGQGQRPMHPVEGQVDGHKAKHPKSR